MAAAQHQKQKTSMFRRIMSPRGDKSKQNERDKKSPRTSSMSNVKNLNGHGSSNDLQCSLEVENSAYRNPELIHQVAHPGRSQSMIYPPISVSSSAMTDSTENPPLPPRNIRPASIGHPPQQLVRKTSDEPALYMAPADTLNRKANASVTSNYSQVETSDALPTRKEVRKMNMHIETMKQKSGHRRVRSIGHVVDSSEYSTPFDLLKEIEGKKETILPAGVRAALDQSGAPPKPPKNHHKQVKQRDFGGEVDIIIPVSSPTPPVILSDHSRTQSPSSPVSTQSSEQELIRDNGTNDYDEPWHDKFKNLNMPTFRHQVPDEPQHVHRTQRHSHHHQVDERTRVGSQLVDRGSPPSPIPWDRGYRGRDPASISPEVPHDRPPAFIKGSADRSSGRREGSVSPNPRTRDIRSYSHSQLPHHPGNYPRHEDQSHGLNPRANSVSVMAGRQLPPPPPERNVEQRYVPKEPSPPPALIDISIPLEDQP